MSIRHLIHNSTIWKVEIFKKILTVFIIRILKKQYFNISSFLGFKGVCNTKQNYRADACQLVAYDGINDRIVISHQALTLTTPLQKLKSTYNGRVYFQCATSGTSENTLKASMKRYEC